MGTEILDCDPSAAWPARPQAASPAAASPAATGADAHPVVVDLDLPYAGPDLPGAARPPLPSAVPRPRPAQESSGAPGRTRWGAVRRTVRAHALWLAAGAVLAAAALALTAGRAPDPADSVLALSVETRWTGGGTPSDGTASVDLVLALHNYGPKAVDLVGASVLGGAARVDHDGGLHARLAADLSAERSLTVDVTCPPVPEGTSAPLEVRVRTLDGVVHAVRPREAGSGDVDPMTTLVRTVCFDDTGGDAVPPGPRVSLEGSTLVLVWQPPLGSHGEQWVQVSSVPGLELVAQPRLPLTMPAGGRTVYRITPVVRTCSSELADPLSRRTVGDLTVTDAQGRTVGWGAPVGFDAALQRLVAATCGGPHRAGVDSR